MHIREQPLQRAWGIRLELCSQRELHYHFMEFELLP